MIIKMPFNRKVNMSPPQLIMFIYFFITIVLAILLYLPISVKENIDISFFDVLFTTVSAITVTGLTVVNISETFNTFGITIIALCMQIGGIGIMTLWTFVWLLLGKKIGLGYRQLIMIDQNRSQFSGLAQVMKLVFGFAILIEVIGIMFFTGIFYFKGYIDNIYEALYYASFHSVSAYTNGGFDIFGVSLYNFSNDYIMQLGTIVLIILGAIGFPVIIELYSYLHSKINKYNFRFSLYTKITVITFFALLILGAVGILISEYHGTLKDLTWYKQIMTSIFNSVTVRSAGLATIDVSSMYESSLFIMAVLMFIGASPSSVGGGIRTTTIATVMLTIRSFVLNEKNVHILGKRLHNEDIQKSFIVLITGIILIIFSIFFVTFIEAQKFTIIEIIFEVTSAFGTCGLSTGITSELAAISKTILMCLMFIGRIGILAFLMSFNKKDNKNININYPLEKIIIG